MKDMRRMKIGAVAVMAVVMTMLWAVAVWGATRLGETERAYWGDKLGEAKWEVVENAKKYEVRLYENEVYVRKVTVSGHKVNLAQYMSDNNWYTFEVRAIPSDQQKKKYSAGEWVASDDGQIATGLGDTDGRFRTYQNGMKYQMDNGEYVVLQWYLIKGNWYYFDANGYMVTGWQEIDGKTYYLGEDGIRLTGWQQLDGSWYYFQEDGSMYKGWFQKAPGIWYYLGEDGRMLTDTVVDGCRLDSSGLWVP